ncbi:MAG: hypothetical protein HOV71_21595 [Hamadaea sp.]|nr:hypothetical protein [Hamadaea sp.]NUR50731.1 hypothetical protein [Hamadaea sp.]NUT03747.1 hypothetical protein [Hamadaea sp.]
MDTAFGQVFGAVIGIGGAVGGAITGAVKATLDVGVDALRGDDPGGTLAATFPAAYEVIFAVTSRRYLAFTLKFGLLRPTYVLAAQYGPADLLQVRVGGGVAMRKLMLVFSDESAVKLNMPRGQGDTDELVRAFLALRAQAQN